MTFPNIIFIADLVVGTVGLSFHNEEAELGGLFSNNQHQFLDTIKNNDPIHFARMNHITPEQKNFILKLGPCQPLPEHVPGKSFPIDNNGRHFSHLWYNRFLPDGSKVLRDWLSYSISENKIFCLHCMLYGVNTHSVSAKSWTNIGFSSWINGVSRINKHELSSEHVTATIKVKIKNQCVPLLPSMEYQKKIQIATNRQIILELIDIILFLARHNLSFRGHNEQWSNPLSRGNFKDLIILMSKNSVPLSEHITKLKSRGRQELSFISWERQNQLIECIAKDISTTIQYQVKNTRFFSIAIDSTFDASRKEQVSFIIRYTCLKSGNVLERLIAMRESPNTCGGDLFSLFKNIMEGEGYDWLTDLVGQSYDGASNMRGAYKGLQALIKEENKHATFVWCHAHRLNLIVKQIVSSNSNSADLFGNLETLYSFVWCAKKRVAIFRQFQTTDSSKSHQPLALKRVCTTRWSSHSAALDTVLKTHKCIINTLTTIQTQEGPSDPKVSATCSGLIQYFTSFRFLITAFVFKKIFGILEPVNKKLQTRDMDLLAATNLLDNAKSKIRELNCRENDSFSEVIKDAEQFSVKSSIDFSSLPVPRYKRIPKKSGELVNDNPINDPIKKIKIECYYGALDLIQTELNDRFGDESSGLLKDLSLLSRKRILEVRLLPNSLPKDAFKQVVELYGEFLEHDALIRNYMDFCQNYLELENTVTLPEYIHKTPNQDSDESEKFFDDFDQDKSDNEDEASTSDRTNIENSGSMNKLFQLCCVLQLKTVFPSLFALLQIAVTLPVSSCSVERSFSKLKLVKTKLRSTMTEDRLENLMIITCEQDFEPNTERVIQYFSTKSTLLSKSLTLI